MGNNAETKTERKGWNAFVSFLAGGGILLVVIGLVVMAMVISYLFK